MRQILTLRKVRLLGASLCTRISRVLLALTACLLLVMPWTEYFCNFDRFLRGGQDTELGLLAVLMVLCLMLVLFQSGRTLLAALLALLHWFAALYRQGKPRLASGGAREGVLAKACLPLFSCFMESCLLQLRI